MSEHDKQGSNESDTPEVFQVARGRGRRQFLQAISVSAAAGAVADSACNDSQRPTTVTTVATTSVPPSTPSTTTRVTTTTTTTTTSAATFTLTVIVTGNDGRGIGDAEVVVTSGPQAGLVKRSDNNGRCELNQLSAGRITIRITKGSTVRTFDVTVTGTQSLEATLPTAGTPTTTTVGGGGGGGVTTSSSTVTLHYWYPN